MSHLKILKTISTTGKQVRARDKLLKPMTMVVAKSGGRVVSLRFAGIVFALFLPVTLCGANAANDFDNLMEVKTLQKGMPKDLVAFISKSAECSHWGNEEPYDKARAEFIRNAALKAGCSRLDGEEIQLRLKYRQNPKVLEIIKKAKICLCNGYAWDQKVDNHRRHARPNAHFLYTNERGRQLGGRR